MIEPLTGIRGPSTGMMFIAAVTLDREKQEIYTVDNDIGDRMRVFPYDAGGNVTPKREIVIYPNGAEGRAQPLRTIRGPKTGLGDPHGVFLDGQNNEIVVANHGNQGGRQPPPGDAPPRQRGVRAAEPPPIVGGRFDEPSISVYNADAKGDVAPIRKIQGAKTGLNWPMAIDVDRNRNEIAVANNGDSSIRIFRRTDTGDVAPVR